MTDWQPDPSVPLAVDEARVARKRWIWACSLEGRKNVDIARELRVSPPAVRQTLMHVARRVVLACMAYDQPVTDPVVAGMGFSFDHRGFPLHSDGTELPFVYAEWRRHGNRVASLF